MLRIAIVEDEKNDAQTLIKFCDRYAKAYQECFSPQTSIEKKLDESQEFV